MFKQLQLIVSFTLIVNYTLTKTSLYIHTRTKKDLENLSFTAYTANIIACKR